MKTYCVITIDERLQVPYCKSGPLESGNFGVSVLASTMEDATRILLDVAMGNGASETTADGKVGERTFEKKTITSMEISDILGWEHNRILRKIRTVLKCAKIDGIDMEKHITEAYRRCGNGARRMYYCLDFAAIDAFAARSYDETTAEKLKQALSEK